LQSRDVIAGWADVAGLLVTVFRGVTREGACGCRVREWLGDSCPPESGPRPPGRPATGHLRTLSQSIISRKEGPVATTGRYQWGVPPERTGSLEVRGCATILGARVIAGRACASARQARRSRYGAPPRALDLPAGKLSAGDGTGH
jgi:hypothetical protein